MTTDTDLRLNCLDLASRTPGDMLENAQKFYAFVTGSPALTQGLSDAIRDKQTVVSAGGPKRGRPPKNAAEVNVEAAPQEHPVGDAVNETLQEIAETVDAPAVAYDEVKAAVLSLAKAKGRDAVVEVLAKFKVDHASKLVEGQWADALVALQYAEAQ